MGKRFLIVACLLILVYGCGTTHHFLPANPIPRKEWQLSINWHYDGGRSLRGLIIPELSYYRGAGTDWNWGLGFQVPFPISHLTAAKYFSIGGRDSWVAYSSVNQLLGENNNPYFELGGNYVKHHRTFDEQFGFGVAYGHGKWAPLLMIGELTDEQRNEFRSRFMPFIRYQIGGTDLAFSYLHYQGKTSAVLASLSDSLRNHNDTICVIEAGNADSIKALRLNDMWPRLTRDAWVLFIKGGDSLIFGTEMRYGSCMVPVIPPERAGGIHWQDYGLRELDIFRSQGDADSGRFEAKAVVSITGLKHKVESREKIVITKYDPRVRHLKNWWFGLLTDHSFAISTYGRSKN